MSESKTKKLQVGDKLYAVKINQRGRGTPEWVTVSKVGRIYFETLEIYGRRFLLDTMAEENTSNNYWKLHNSKEERDAEELASLNRQKAKNTFDVYGKVDLTDDQIARIVAIIEEPKQ